jgi:hypothetical protein
VSEVQADPVPPVGVDLNRPSVARVYDYYLGGTANWAIDREFADRVLDKFPLLRDVAIANRMFLNRAVRHLTRLGVKQFLDIGAGVPTAGNTHQVADEVVAESGGDPDVRVVYVDNEPVAVAHAELLLDQQGDPARQAVIDGDLRDPQELWRRAMETELLDPDQPIAVMLIAVLHVQQPGPDGTDVGPRSVAALREMLPVGSYMAISHVTDEGVAPGVDDKLDEVKKMYDASSASNVIWRTRADIATLLGDFRLVEPGWAWTPEWHPEETGPTVRQIKFPTPNHAAIWSGVGQKTN